jgi:RsiW-degrading membrane proteinase PrsW (M82 family)
MFPIYLVCFGALVVAAVILLSVSIHLLMRGRFYHRLKPESRPRRWVVYLFLSWFVAFVLWFPVCFIWPGSFMAQS